MNRGSLAVDGRSRDSGLPPSMRPRFMNRGSAVRAVLVVVLHFAFNEAPIHESGKCRAKRSPGAPTPAFNEAPIHESGKCALLLAAA